MGKPSTEITEFSILKENAQETTAIFRSTPTPVEEKNLGRLFAIVEIESISKVNTEIIDLMIHDINRYYYRAESLEIEAAFENALQKTNRRLQELIGEVGEDWIHQLTALFGVQKNNELVFANVGKAIALMAHGNTIIDILDTAKAKAQDISPVKIFSNIVTGEITEGSRILLSTESILDYLSKEKIRRVLNEHTGQKISNVFHELLEQNANDVNFASLILEYQDRIATQEPINTPTHIEKRPAMQPEIDSMEDLQTRQADTEELLSSSLWPSVKKRIKEKVEERQNGPQEKRSSAQQYNDDILTGPGTPISSSSESSDWKRIAIETFTTGKKIAIQGASTVKNHSVAAYKKLRSRPSGIKDIAEKTEKKNAALTSTHVSEQRIKRMQTHAMEKTLARWITPIVRWIGSLTLLQKIFFALAIVVLIVFGQAVIDKDDSKNTQAEENQYAQTIADIDLKINKGKAAIVYDNKAEAQQLLGEAQELLETIPVDSEVYQQRGAELTKVIQDEMNSLNGITALTDLPAVVNFASIADTIDIKHIVLLGGTVYGFDASNGSIYRGNVENGEVSVAREDRDTGAVTAATKASPGTALLAKANGVLSLYNPIENTVENLDIPDDGVTKTPVDVTVFGSRIYTLDPTNDQIYRYDQVTGGYSEASPWIADDVTVETGVSLAIDADVYVLKQDGTIIKMASGLKEDFTLDPVEPAIQSGQKIFTNENSDFLYILDAENKRVVVFTKEGKLTTQYVSNSFTNLRDMAVDEEEGKMYLLNGAQVYEIDISGQKAPTPAAEANPTTISTDPEESTEE